MWGMTTNPRLSPATVLIRLNRFSDSAQRKTGLVLQGYAAWQSPRVLSEVWAARSDGRAPLALHGLGPVEILLFRLPNCKQTSVYLTASSFLLPLVFLLDSSLLLI